MADSTSRVRKVDKTVLSQSSDGVVDEKGSKNQPVPLLDIDDQNDIISKFQRENIKSFIKFKKFLIILLFLQIPLQLILYTISKKQLRNLIQNPTLYLATTIKSSTSMISGNDSLLKISLSNLLITFSIIISIINLSNSDITSLRTGGGNGADQLDVTNPFLKFLIDNLHYINGIICIQILVLLYLNLKKDMVWYLNLNYILPIMDFIIVQMFNYWFKVLDDDIKHLIKLRYKYKNV